MTAEPNDVETLADLLHRAATSNADELARRVLASDWLDAVRRKAGDDALAPVRALCDEWDVLSKGETSTTRRIREALR